VKKIKEAMQGLVQSRYGEKEGAGSPKQGERLVSDFKVVMSGGFRNPVNKLMGDAIMSGGRDS
jgi:hypothetical protein